MAEQQALVLGPYQNNDQHNAEITEMANYAEAKKELEKLRVGKNRRSIFETSVAPHANDLQEHKKELEKLRFGKDRCFIFGNIYFYY